MTEKKPFLLNNMTIENEKYYNNFRTAMKQMHDKSGKAKKELEETLLSDLIRLSHEGKSAETFYGEDAVELAKNWAEELSAPTLFEMVKSNLLWILYAVFLSLPVLLQWRRGSFIMVILLLTTWFLVIFGSYLLGRLFPKTSRKTRALCVAIPVLAIWSVAMILTILFFMKK